MHWKQVAEFEPQANKSFSVQQFFKNAAEVWASSPHLRSKWNCLGTVIKIEERTGRIAIAFKNKRLRWWNKVSGAIAIPKASWGCAPALPNRIRVVFLEELLLGKTVFSVRQKGVPPLLLPAAHNWKPNWKIYLPMARSIPTNIKTISVPTTSINFPIKTKNLLQKEKPLGGNQRPF